MSTAKKQTLKLHFTAWWHHAVLNVAFTFYNLRKLRILEAAKAFFFILPPPQLHHKRKDISDLSKQSTKDWFRFGWSD